MTRLERLIAAAKRAAAIKDYEGCERATALAVRAEKHASRMRWRRYFKTN